MKSRPPYAAEATWVREQITSLVEAFPAREAGSGGEWQAQREIARRFGLWADRVDVEAFGLHPKAFMGFLPLVGVLLLASIPAYFLAPLWGLALVLVVLLVSTLQFGLYKKLLDPLFPRADSCNVIATQEAAGERKRVLLLGGHVDGAYEWRFHHWGGSSLLKAVVLSNIVALAAAFVLHLGNAIAGGGWRAAGLAFVFCAPAWLCTLLYSDFSRVVPGAIDNLSGVFVAAAVPRALATRSIALQHTELRILSTGAEEAGLRGAKAYVKKHREELAGCESIFIALETFGAVKDLMIYDRDLNATSCSDAASRELLRRASARVGLDLPYGAIVPGSSDAAAFQQAKLRAVAIAGMSHEPPRYYHTRRDAPEALDERCLERAIAIAVEAARIFDREGVEGLEEG